AAQNAIPRDPGDGQPAHLLRLPIIISHPGEDHMTRWATLAIALLFSAIATIHTTDTASSQAAADGWITLFDGKNLDQWQSDGTATFKIEDGSVIATDKKDPKAVAAYLISKQSFKDFEIRAEFWVSDDAK